MWQAVTDFYTQPYKGLENMNALQIFALVGLLLLIIIAWRILLSHILEGV